MSFTTFYRHSFTRYRCTGVVSKKRSAMAVISSLKESSLQSVSVPYIFNSASTSHLSEASHHHFNEKVLRGCNRVMFMDSLDHSMRKDDRNADISQLNSLSADSSSAVGSPHGSIYFPTTTFKMPHQKLLQAIQYIPKNMRALEELHAREGSDYDEDIAAARLRSGLYLRQVKLEEEQHLEAVCSYLESVKLLVGMNRASSMKFVQRVLLSWFDPLTEAINLEIENIKAKVKGTDRTVMHFSCPYVITHSKF